MPDPFPVPPPDFSVIIALLGHLNHTALLYLAAAVIARFWHKHMWAIYLLLAVASSLTAHP